MEQELPPALHGRYEKLGVLGQGAMGVVFRVRDRQLDREVALKQAQTSQVADLEVRFQREAEGLSRLSHPNVVRIFDFGVLPEGLYLTMEVLDGVDLRRLMECEAPSEIWAPLVAEPVERMLEVAAALQAMHDAGLVHRDLKPGNIVVTRDGRPVLIDFGLLKDPKRTRVTKTGQFVGTPIYMAPECLLGSPANPRSDWYAWGAVLYELLEGRPPFGLAAVVELVNHRPVSIPEPRTSRGVALAPALATLLDPDPDQRPADLGALRRLLEGEPRRVSSSNRDRARRPSTVPSSSPRPSRKAASSLAGTAARAAAAAGGLALCGLLGRGALRSVTPAPQVEALPAEESEELRQLRDAFRRVTKRYRGEDGALLHALGGRSFREHLRLTREAFSDPRMALRWRRAAEALRSWGESRPALPLGEADRKVLDEEIVVALENLVQDFSQLAGEVALKKNLLGAVVGGSASPTSDTEAAIWELTMRDLQGVFKGVAASLPPPRSARLRCLRASVYKLADEHPTLEALEALSTPGPTPTSVDEYLDFLAQHQAKVFWKRRGDCEQVAAMVRRGQDFALGPMTGLGPEMRVVARGLMVSHWSFDRVACPRGFDEDQVARLEGLVAAIEPDIDEVPWVADLYLTWATLNTLLLDGQELPSTVLAIHRRILAGRDRARALLRERERR